MSLVDLKDKEPNEIIIMIEKGSFNHFNQLEWLDLCNILMRKCKEKKNYNLYRLIQKETYVHTSEIRNDVKRLAPFAGEEFDFNDKDLKYFLWKATNTNNVLLKAKYFDILWQESEEKNVEFVINAIDGYLNILNFFFKEEKYHYLTKILVHSLDLSLSSNNQDLIERCVKKLEEMIVKLSGLDKIRCIYDLLKVIIDNYGELKSISNKDLLLDAIGRGKIYYENRDSVWKNRFNEFERKILENSP